MQIQLLHDRMDIHEDDYKNPIFLVAGKYDLVREVPGLGWLVQTNYDAKYPQCTIIRYGKGKVC